MAKTKLRALSGVLTGALLLSCVSFTSFAEEEIPADDNQAVEDVSADGNRDATPVEENQEPEASPSEKNQEPEAPPKEGNQEPEAAPEVDNQTMNSAPTDAGDAIVSDDAEQNGEDTLSENDIQMEGLIEDPVFTAAEEDVSAAEGEVTVSFWSDSRSFDMTDLQTKWNGWIDEDDYDEDYVDVTGRLDEVDFYWIPQSADSYMIFDCWCDWDDNPIIFSNTDYAFYYDDNGNGVLDKGETDQVEFEENYLELCAHWKFDVENVNASDIYDNDTDKDTEEIDLDNNEVIVFKFTTGNDSAYKFYSSITKGYPGLEIFNSSGISYGRCYDNYEMSDGKDFFLQMHKYDEDSDNNESGVYYEAGDTFYFVITQFDEQAVQGSVTLEAGGHDHIWGDWIEDYPATVGEAGYRWRYCRICGEEEGEDIPALPAPQPAPAPTPQPTPVVQAPPAPAPDPITITKAPVLKSVKAAKKGAKATVNLKKLEKPKKKGKKKKNTNSIWNQVSSIQLQYSTDPTFATGVITKTLGKGKASVNIGGLQKGVVYYVRARYAGNGGYSNWSATKTVKVKNQKKGKKK